MAIKSSVSYINQLVLTIIICLSSLMFIYPFIWLHIFYLIYGYSIELLCTFISILFLCIIGGILSNKKKIKYTKKQLLFKFSILELSLGIFGFISLNIYNLIGKLTNHLTFISIGIILFLLLSIPLILMGKIISTVNKVSFHWNESHTSLLALPIIYAVSFSFFVLFTIMILFKYDNYTILNYVINLITVLCGLLLLLYNLLMTKYENKI